MKFRYSTLLSMLFVAISQSILSMNPESGPQNPQILALALASKHVDLGGKIKQVHYQSTTTYIIDQPDTRLIAHYYLPNLNRGEYIAINQSLKNADETILLPDPKKILEDLAKKFNLQQSSELQAAKRSNQQNLKPEQVPVLPTAVVIAAPVVSAVSTNAMHSSATAAALAQTTNQKTQQQQNEELRAAIQPGHAYWVAAQASDYFEDWVEVSQSNL